MTSDFTVAVHAIVYLRHKKICISSKQLADNICTHPARVRRVMSKIISTGVINRQSGKNGGYSYIEKKLSLYEVLEALDERLLEAHWTSGDENMECLVASNMHKEMEAVYDDLNICINERLKNIYIEDIEKHIFLEETEV